MLKKILAFVGILLILSYSFFSAEYLLYTIFTPRSIMFVIFFALFIVLMFGYIMVLNKIELFRQNTNYVLVLLSVILGLAWLYMFINK